MSELIIRFAPRREREAPLLVLFHEDGTDEAVTLPLGRRLWPGAPLAAVRGGYPDGRGWRHLSEPADEVADLFLETAAGARIAASVRRAAAREPSLIETVGIGTGGGADAVLALLCLYPRLLTAAVLLEPRRRWAGGWEESIVATRGVEVLVAHDETGSLSAMMDGLMLSRCGHRAVRWIGPAKEQTNLAARWLRSELRGETEGEDAP
ncbi:MAG: hypothetical protein JO048_02555 [Methylobacteriaceae bacterium]|nr:hypothetical protein [Methylobacteriaceae bacterium]